MIAGIGTDLVSVARVTRAVDRFGERFARRILEPEELAEWADAPDPPKFLAKRFAAKEAAAKALGFGMAGGISWQDFRVTHDARGAPHLDLQGRAATVAGELGVSSVHLSISDELEHALAFVVLETAEA